MDFIFVTYEARPEPSASDALVVQWLLSQGHTVRGVPWTQDASEFGAADLIVVRSTWDYPQQVDRFGDWLDEICTLPIANPVKLMRWNLNKRYLLDLAEAGIYTPRAQILSHPAQLAQIMADWSVAAAVVKPLVGASGAGVTKVDAESELTHFEPNAFLVQEFVPQIEHGELSLVFFEGKFSHAIIKEPLAGEFRINAAFGGKNSAYVPTSQMIDSASQVLGSLNETPLYARVDGVMVADEFMLFELELIEPSFYFPTDPEAAANFGRAIVNRAKTTSGLLRA